MTKKHKKQSQHIVIGVAISMIIIVFAWLAWFYPANNIKDDKKGGFNNFAKEILNSLSIFADKTEDNKEIDVNDLRERVFGDTIAR